MSTKQSVERSGPLTIEFHHRPEGPAGEYTMEKIEHMLIRFAEKLRKRSPVKSMEVYLHDPKNRVGKTVEHSVMLHMHCWSGSRYVASAEGYASRAKHVGLESCVRQAMKEIEEQIRRKHVDEHGGS